VSRVLVVALASLALVPASAGAASIEMDASDHDVFSGETFRLFGTATGYNGQIALLTDEFPFEGAYVEFKRTGTTDEGNFKSATGNPPPRRNSRYVAEGGGARSEPVTVYVSPRRSVSERRIAPDRVRATIRLNADDEFTLADTRMYAYLRGRGEERLRRLGGARRLVRVGDGRYRVTTTVRLPSNRPSRWSLRYCVRHLARAGYGRTTRLAVHCGETSIDAG
jgi:hypothetical protein